jgi:beta-glucosidase
MTKRSLLIGLIAALLVAVSAPTALAAHSRRSSGTPIYLNPSYSFQERAADLVSRMTLAEKASQMVSSQAPAIPRLGIPAWGWWNEALHGVSRLQLEPSGNATTLFNTTSYPIDLSMGSSWDPGLMYRVASQISDEAREVAPDNSRDLDFYSPTINLARDPRWGRNDETYSEDPFLTAAMASQFVDGMEGKDLNGGLLRQGGGYLKTITTIKHFAANNSEVNRLTGSSNMDERTLREYYTAQFKRIIEHSQPGSIMSSYNEVNGVPSAANVHLMDTLARETFGFQGYFTSDCDAIYEIQNGHHWQPPSWTRPLNEVERHAFAMSAGEDLDCNAGYHDQYSYANTVPTAVQQHIKTQTDTFNEGDVDTALVRLFTARMKLGEFDDVSSEPWVKAARARLPEGSWTNSDSNGAVTETPARLTLAREAGDKSLVLLKNSATTRKDGSAGELLPIRVPRSGPFRVAVIGPFANPSDMYLGGYSSTQGSAGAAKEVSAYAGLKRAIQAIDPDAVVDFYNGFTGAGSSANTFTNIDPAAVNAAANYDDAIVYAGTDSTTAAEDGDRSNLALPGAQADLINQVAARNPNTVAVMETIGQVDVTSFEPNVAAMVWSSYNGERKGDSLADVLLGDYNPSGRLPFMWYRSMTEIPPITDYAIRPEGGNPGRTYMYFNGALSYPFGYGLSYSSFKYSHLRIDRTRLSPDGVFRATVDVTNTGPAAGRDAVELYVTTPDAPSSLERPHKRLEAFRQVSLDPGQTRSVTMPVKVGDLAFFDEAQNRYVVDQGRYGVQIASSSADSDVQQQGVVSVSGRQRELPQVVTIKPTMRGDAARDVATRVIFPVGATVVPHVTVAMDDESLYGYITKGASTPLPRGLRLSFTSDHPDVVAIGHRGGIRTLREGVATVTVTASYHGLRRSTSFPLRVMGG